MMHWTLIVALLLAGAGAALALLLRRQEWRDSRRRFQEVLAGQEETGWLAAAVAEGAGGRGADALGRVPRLQTVDLELRRAGWNAPFARNAYFLAASLAPAVGALAGAIWGGLSGQGAGGVVALAFLGFGTGYLLPPRVLGWRARARQKAMRGELLAMLHLLRMLFDAGLSLEHALRVIAEQGRELAPELTAEIALALNRINAGQEWTDALEEMASPLAVPELDDTVAVLRQATRYGGNLRESLTRFVLLLEDRRLTSLREYVSKLSAKMTAVTMVFMFPALLLFLAGPGFLALGRALMRVS